MRVYRVPLEGSHAYYDSRALRSGGVLYSDVTEGYGPEVFGYVNPIDSTFRVAVVFQNDLLNPMPSSKATVRIYLYGVLKALREGWIAGAALDTYQKAAAGSP